MVDGGIDTALVAPEISAIALPATVMHEAMERALYSMNIQLLFFVLLLTGCSTKIGATAAAVAFDGNRSIGYNAVSSDVTNVGWQIHRSKLIWRLPRAIAIDTL